MRTTAFAQQALTMRSVLISLAGILLFSGCSSTVLPSTSAGSTSTQAAVATTTTAPTPTSTRAIDPSTSTAAPVTAGPQPTAPEEIPERSLYVPAATPPTIDGTMDDGEWSAAATVSMSNNDTLYWIRDEHTLYVALDGTELGAVNLLLATGNELWILHSSAALGSSLYRTGEGGWEQSHGYSWCCRSASDDTGRLGLLDREGWQANIGFTGDVGVVEYQVVIPWGFSMAAVAYHTEDGASAYWPTDLPPEAVSHVITNQWTDPSFDPGQWWMLVPDDAAPG